MHGRKRLTALIAAIAVVFVLLALARHTVGRVVITQTLSIATGYHFDIGEIRLQSGHGAFINTHVSKNGEPVLDAVRIDITYNLRDLLPGSTHRFGLESVAIDQPHLTIIHHRNGTYNVGQLGTAATGSSTMPGAYHAGTPLDLTARIRRGSATLIDDYQYYKESRTQAIHDINLDLNTKSDVRTHYVLTGAFLDAVKDEPLRAVGTVDYRHGYALHHIMAAAVPIKAIGNYFINSPAARIVAGTAKHFDARIYALDVRPGLPVNYHTSGTLGLSDGQLYINGLAKPLDDLRGSLQIADSGLSARTLNATIAGLPIVVAGSIYKFADPRFFLGLQGQGDLSVLKTIVASGSHYPLTGATRFDTLIEGPIANPLILFGFASPRLQYDKYPVQNATGVMTLYKNMASIVPLRGRYGGLTVSVRGTLALGKHVGSEIAIAYGGNASDLPYLGSLVPGSAIAGEAVAQGTDTAIGVAGSLADSSNAHRLSAYYSLTPQGYGTIGPLRINRNGGTLYANFALDRPNNSSAFWISARNFALEPARGASMPGLQLPDLSQFAGHTIDADIAGTGAANDVSLGGRVAARNIVLAGTHVDSLRADFAGPLTDLSIARVAASGPWGTFDGNGAYQDGGVAARGNFEGSLDALPFASSVAAHGNVHGPIALAYEKNGTLILQSDNARLSNVSVQGIAVQSFNGTVALGKGRVRIYSASGQIAGANFVAGGALGDGQSVAIATADAGPQAARAFGLPLQAGQVALIGTVGQSGNAPTFDGGVAVSNGVAAGYPVQGSSELHLGRSELAVTNATVTLAGTYGALDGHLTGVRSGRPAYALVARVPAGDIATASRALHIPTFSTVGSFDANLSIGGSGSAPSVSGPLSVPVGQINGMDFEDAHAQIAAGPGGVSAHRGAVVVGTTRTSFDATLRGRTSAISLNAPHADLSDFNDFFNTGDTLAGRGSVVLSMVRTNLSIGTSGDVDVQDFRYRRLPIGNTDAEWSSHDGLVGGRLSVGGAHGRLAARGTVALAPAQSLGQILARSRYDISAQLFGLDTTTWLPAFGYPTVPLTGRVDATATLHGRYPQIALMSEATLKAGTIGRVPIDLLHMRAHSEGTRIALTHFDLEVPALVASGTGSFGFGPRDAINFTMSAQSNDLPTLTANFIKRPLGLKGNLQSQLTLAGTWHKPQVGGNVYLTNANLRGVVVPQLVASLALRGRDLQVRNAEVTFTKGSVAVAGALPLQLSPFGVGPPSAPFSMDFFATNTDLSDFVPLLPAGTKAGGLLNGHLGVNGTVSNPQIRGGIALTQGSYVSPFETAPVTQTVAQIVFAGTRATLSRLHAQLGGGTLDASGDIAFDRGASGNQVVYAIDAKSRGAVLHFPAYGSGTIDSTLQLTKDAGKLAQLTGTLTATNAVIPFAALIGHSSSPAVEGAQAAIATVTGATPLPDAAPPGFPFNLGFNLGVTAGKNVAVRASALGYGIDIGAKGHAVLAGTLAQPTLDGAFSATGGSLTFIDHVFKVQEGRVTFTPADGVIPQLYAIGTTQVSAPESGSPIATGSIGVTIKVTGPATNPTLAFSSDPAGLSRDQIIAMLTPLGAITGLQFDDNGNALAPGQLAGAPPQTTGQPMPPGAFRHQAGALSIGQEAFNILNAQFAHSLLTPIENALGGTLGLSSVNLTLDYRGNVGLSVRRPVNAKLSAVYATTFGYPSRQTYGFQYAPNEDTVAQLTFFQQRAPVTFFGAGGYTPVTTDPNVTVGQPINGNNGFTFSLQRLFW
ncbi:MAG: translocation/assembly module TamB domain-containing protein [Candidatus Baltobacteraceae bacterium]